MKNTVILAALLISGCANMGDPNAGKTQVWKDLVRPNGAPRPVAELEMAMGECKSYALAMVAPPAVDTSSGAIAQYASTQGFYNRREQVGIECMRGKGFVFQGYE